MSICLNHSCVFFTKSLEEEPQKSCQIYAPFQQELSIALSIIEEARQLPSSIKGLLKMVMGNSDK